MKKIVSLWLVMVLLVVTLPQGMLADDVALSSVSSLSKEEQTCAQWTKSLRLVTNTYPKHGGYSTGYYDTGTYFSGIVYSSTWREGTDAIWNLNPSTYYSAVANPASLLYTVDCRGRANTEAAWSGSVCSTTAMKACGYAFPYTSDEVRQGFTKKAGHSIDILEVGDMLWTSGHVAGVIGVNVLEDGRVASVKIVEQAWQVTVFEVTAENWEKYFASHWTAVYRGEIEEDWEVPEEFPNNFSIIFERGNNTYVTEHETMLFYIPTATTVYCTKDGETTSYAVSSFPTRVVNNTTVYDLASLFDGVGDYYFHTNVDETDIGIKVIGSGDITITGTTATLGGYENCKPIAYRIIKVLDANISNTYNYYNAPRGYTSIHLNLSYRKLSADTFDIENIPDNTAGWKLEVFYDTGYGWARFLSDDMWNGDHAHDYATRTVVGATCARRGYTAYTCACGEVWKEDYVDALSHTEGQAVAECITQEGFDLVYYCTVCGEESTRCLVSADSHVAGDADGDGKVNNRDLGLLQQYLNGWDVQVNKYASDVNGDNKLNNRDLGLLLQYLNGWDVQLRLWWPN